MSVPVFALAVLLALTARAQIVHFGTANAGIVSDADTNGAAWVFSIKGPVASLPTSDEIAALYNTLVVPSSTSEALCALSGSFTTRAVRLALACPADSSVQTALLATLQNQCAELPQPCTVTSERNSDVAARTVRSVIHDKAPPVQWNLGRHMAAHRKRGVNAAFQRPRAPSLPLRVTAASSITGTVTISSATQVNVRWGLDRIKTHPLIYDNTYIYDETGSESDLWIVDTGIRPTHDDFGGRVTWVANTIDSEDSDCNGHGTNVASIAGGTVYGVAKGVLLYAVKVLDCNGEGTIFTVLAGLDVVASHRSATRATVINLSLSAPSDSSLNSEVTSLVLGSGIAVVVAAGNSQGNVADYSPSGAANITVVTATDSSDSFATDFANWGANFAAPGVDIIAAWNTSDTAVEITTGTSMASPHAAGTLTLYWALIANKQDAVGAMATMISHGTYNVVTHVPQGPVPPLVYSRQVATPAAPGDAPQPGLTQPASNPPLPPPPPPPPRSPPPPPTPPSPPSTGSQPLTNQPTDPAPPMGHASELDVFSAGGILSCIGLFVWLYVL